MNIFFQEMRANRRSLIIWCAFVLFMVFAGMGKFSAAETSGQSYNQLMAQMPKALQTLFGSGSFDLTTALGFYGMVYIYLVIMAAIHAAMLGGTIISKEERDKTMEFLLVKPASRKKIITSKLSASLLNLILFNLVTWVSSIFAVGYYAKGESVNRAISLLMAAMFILQVTYLLVGAGIAAVSKKPKAAASAAAGVILVTFILSMAVDMNDKLEPLKYVTPFKYYDAKNLMYGGTFEPVFLTISLITIAVLLGITYKFYTKRDMSI